MMESGRKRATHFVKVDHLHVYFLLPLLNHDVYCMLLDRGRIKP